jgi:hypothetical protein
MPDPEAGRWSRVGEASSKTLPFPGTENLGFWYPSCTVYLNLSPAMYATGCRS